MSRKSIVLIAAIGQKGEMGAKGSLPWSHPEDLLFFKKMTRGCPLIMGRKTFESLPGILPGRLHIVLSSQRPLEITSSQVIFVSTPDQAIAIAMEQAQERVFVIGGAQIYQLFSQHYSSLFITHMENTFDADIFFPMEILRNRSIISEMQLPGPSFTNYNAIIREYGPAS